MRAVGTQRLLLLLRLTLKLSATHFRKFEDTADAEICP